MIRRLVEAVESNLEDIDAILIRALENWRLRRLSRIDRSILRLAAAEMIFVDETPPKVALQEAIRLAGQFGGAESPRFVNGVLDAVLATIPPPSPDDRSA
jgi:transcription antitermination protein NusB